MGLFRRKKAERQRPLVIDADMLLLDEGRMLAREGRYMEAVVTFEKAERAYREKLRHGTGDEVLLAGCLVAALGNHALVLARNLHRPDEALPLARKALALTKQRGLRGMLAEHERILQTVEDLLV